MARNGFPSRSRAFPSHTVNANPKARWIIFGHLENSPGTYWSYNVHQATLFALPPKKQHQLDRRGCYLVCHLFLVFQIFRGGVPHLGKVSEVPIGSISYNNGEYDRLTLLYIALQVSDVTEVGITGQYLKPPMLLICALSSTIVQINKNSKLVILTH